MPRNTDLPAHLEEIKQRVQEGQKGRAQYNTRLLFADAETFIEDCIETGEQPGEAIRRMVKTYLDIKATGIVIKLGKQHKAILSELNRLTGDSHANIIRDLISEYGLKKVNELKSLGSK